MITIRHKDGRLEDLGISWYFRIPGRDWDLQFCAIAKVPRIFSNAHCLISVIHNAVWITKIVRPLQLPGLLKDIPRDAYDLRRASKNALIEFDIVSLYLERNCKAHFPLRNLMLKSTSWLLSFLGRGTGIRYDVVDDAPNHYPDIYDKFV